VVPGCAGREVTGDIFITTASRRILRASVLGDEPQLRCKRSSKAGVAKPFGEAESFLHNVKETPSVSSELNVEDLRAGGGFITVAPTD